MKSERDVDELVEDLRHNSPFPALLGIVIAALVLAAVVNLMTSAFYDAWLAFGALLFPRADPAAVRVFCAMPVLLLSFLLALASCSYLFALSRRQQPSVRRFITLVLPFIKRQDKGQDKVRLLEIPKLHAHNGMDQALNGPLEKRARAGEDIHWHDSWAFESGGNSPIQGDAVTIIYDLAEWMVLKELAEFGGHLYAGKKFTRPGDDFNELPAAADLISLPWPELYRDTRGNFLGHAANNFENSTLKLPQGTHIRLVALPACYGVAQFGKQPVRAILITNPAGSLRIWPSQIWRQVTGQQARSLLTKLFAKETGEKHYLDSVWLPRCACPNVPSFGRGGRRRPASTNVGCWSSRSNCFATWIGSATSRLTTSACW